jgi:ATP-dependent DNA ligase
MASPSQHPALPAQLPLELGGDALLELPAQPEPMRARPIAEPFDSPEYLFETRWNGIRALASIMDGQVRLHNHRLGDLSSRFPELRPLAQAAADQPLLIDGEIVIVDERGHPELDQPQYRLRLLDEQHILAEAMRQPACFLASDLLFRGRRWTVGEPLWRRKRWLAEALHPCDCLYLAEHFETEGRALFQAAVDSDLEGILAKPKDSVYAAGGTTGWLAVAREREELVIGGYSLQIGPAGGRMVELLLGGYDAAGQFLFAAPAAPPEDEILRAELSAALNALQAEQPPFAEPPPFIACWVRPELVVTVNFGQRAGQAGPRVPFVERVRLDVAPDDCLLPGDMPAARPRPAPEARPQLTMLTTLPLPLEPAESEPRERPRLRLVNGD